VLGDRSRAGRHVGQVREVIRAEAGEAAPDDERRRGEDLHRAAVDAVRAYTRPGSLAYAPFTRAAIDRAAAAAAAFGPGAEDQQLRRVVELADLDASLTHDQAMDRLAVSRATYFRYLRQARQRVAATLVDQAQGSLPT
jgi:hypothetical protein